MFSPPICPSPPRRMLTNRITWLTTDIVLADLSSSVMAKSEYEVIDVNISSQCEIDHSADITMETGTL